MIMRVGLHGSTLLMQVGFTLRKQGLHADWNPQVDLQAQARVHRLGQTKQVLAVNGC